MFPVLSIGPLSLPAPAFILLAGFFLGSYLVEKKARSYSIAPEIIDRVLWIGLLSGIIGARLSFVAASPTAFRGNLLSIISLNPALLDPVGGLLIASATILIFLARKEIDYWVFLDSLTPLLGIIMTAINLSQFAAGKGYGIQTDQPWGVYLWGTVRHPVQLYYFGLSIIVLLIIYFFAPFRNFPPGSSFLFFGSATFGYLLFLSYFQEPVSLAFGSIRSDQLLFWVGFLIFLGLLNYRLEKTQYKAQYEIKK